MRTDRGATADFALLAAVVVVQYVVMLFVLAVWGSSDAAGFSRVFEWRWLPVSLIPEE
jgi:hypothetical protein